MKEIILVMAACAVVTAAAIHRTPLCGNISAAQGRIVYRYFMAPSVW